MVHLELERGDQHALRGRALIYSINLSGLPSGSLYPSFNLITRPEDCLNTAEKEKYGKKLG